MIKEERGLTLNASSSMLYKTLETAKMMTKSDPNMLTMTDFAAFIGVHYMTARNYANDGLLAGIGAYRLPKGYWRIPRAGAEQFKAQLQGAAAPPPPAPVKNAPAKRRPHTAPRKKVKRPARKR